LFKQVINVVVFGDFRRPEFAYKEFIKNIN